MQTHATQLTTRLARLTGAEPKLLPVQGIATSREAKLLMLADPSCARRSNSSSPITLAIIGIGAVEPSELLARSGNIFSARELTDLAEAGAVGDMSLRFFDRTGKPVKTPLMTTASSAFRSKNSTRSTASSRSPAAPARPRRLPGRCGPGSLIRW